MEPQINYGSENPMQRPKIYGRSRFGGRGCFTIIGPAILLIIIIIAGVYFAYPALTPNSIHGDFLDMAIVPQKDGSQNLWVLTDGSFSFIQTTKSPGSYSSGVKCYFCKTWTYIYDPASEKILKKIKTEQQDVINAMNIIYSNDKVWVITGGYHENEPKIESYDAQTSGLVMDTKAFIAMYPVLSGGLSGIRYDEKENTIVFATKDGREQITYSIVEDKMWNNQGDFDQYKRNAQEIETVAVLNPEEGSGANRKRLYKFTGRSGKLYSMKSSLEDFPVSSSGVLDASDSITAEPTTGKIYLEGIIYYQDKECAVLIHLDQLGKKSNRILTCVDLKTGKEKWTVQQDNLFSRMKIDENADSFSDLFFTKDKLKVRRSDNLVVLEMKDEGLMGFDYETGKRLWKMSI